MSLFPSPQPQREARPSASAPPLTKRRFLAGTRCAKRLWLQVHAPQLATPPDAGLRQRFEAGAEVGHLARQLYPGGVEVDVDTGGHAAAVRHTHRLLADPTVPAVFEACLEYAGVRARVDVLERLPGGAWGVREVKSSTRLEAAHLVDVALQRFVAEGAGVRIASAQLLHVERGFIRGDGPLDPARLFVRREVLADTDPLLHRVQAHLINLRALLAHDTPPRIEPSRHCLAPQRCEFWAHCTSSKPADWVLNLPRLPQATYAELVATGVTTIGDIPDAVALDDVQARARRAARTQAAVVEPGLAHVVAGLALPVAALDFETVAPAVPRFAGTRPYQQVPCQFSLLRVARDGSESHRAFLSRFDVDPRPAFAATLVAALAGSDEPVLVWGHFEDTVLGELAAALPSWAAPIHAIRARLVDLCAVVRSNVAHPGFHGRFGLKTVAPALVPGFTWATAAIRSGDEAGATLATLMRGEVRDPRQRARLRRALLDYCALDTRATVAVYRALVALAGGSR